MCPQESILNGQVLVWIRQTRLNDTNFHFHQNQMVIESAYQMAQQMLTRQENVKHQSETSTEVESAALEKPTDHAQRTGVPPPECPHHKAAMANPDSPFYQQHTTTQAPGTTSSEPAPLGCSSARINPLNMMDTDLGASNMSDPTLLALPDQRQVSSIPRTPTSDDPNAQVTSDGKPVVDRWVYPSQQQFYQAMKRKNHDPQANDMSVIVPLHNAINERAWNMILEWEEKYKQECGGVTLKKFMGKPGEPSPRALWNTWVRGLKEPFDRHDWVVDRCGKEVRYVLDFYQGKGAALGLGAVSVYVDARPALDSFEAAWDRVTRWFKSK